MPNVEGLGAILRRVVGRMQTDYAPVEEEPAPACPICHGAGVVSHGFKVQSSDGRGHVWNAQNVPCGCLADLYVQTFANFKASSRWPDLATARVMAENWTYQAGPPILVLNAERGRGKSHLSKASVNQLRGRGEAVAWFTHGDILDRLHASFGDSGTGSLMQSIESAKWMVIDDLGQSEVSKTMEGLVDRIIDKRSEAAERGCRTLFTTNLLPNDYSDRTRSRLKDVRMVKSYTIVAPDFRLNPIGDEDAKS